MNFTSTIFSSLVFSILGTAVDSHGGGFSTPVQSSQCLEALGPAATPWEPLIGALSDKRNWTVPTVFYRAPGSHLPPVERPSPLFWKKDRLQKKLIENRDILVSVNSKSVKGGLTELKLQGVGHLRVSTEVAFKKMQDFDRLPEVSEHIVETIYDKEAQLLYVRGEAYGYFAEMLFQMDFVKEGSHQEIRFRTIRGLFAGMRGALRFEPLKPKGTEISLLADHSFREAPLPQFFLEFGLEVVLRHVAAKLRTYIEKGAP